MKGFTFATVAALAATSFAATVTLQQAPFGQTNASLPTFDVQVDKLTVVDLESVYRLKIVSADGADVKTIKCKAYKDAEGAQPGSAEFTFDHPADISTNPVQEKAILCVSSGAVPTAQPTTFAAVTTSVSLAAPTGGASTTGNSTGGKPSSPSPSASSGPGEGAASTLQMSLGALSFAAFAALLL